MPSMNQRRSRRAAVVGALLADDRVVRAVRSLRTSTAAASALPSASVTRSALTLFARARSGLVARRLGRPERRLRRDNGD